MPPLCMEAGGTAIDNACACGFLASDHRLHARRYSPSTGQLKLVCERYAERDENRAHILEQLYALAEEGRRVHPPQQAAAALTS